MRNIILLICCLMATILTHGQTLTRDGFVEILGKKVDAVEVQQFFASYDIQNKSAAKYTSRANGIDIDTRNDIVVNVNIYKSSPIYGSYPGKLSKGLTFGMTYAQVADKLGKPTTAYTNSGYSEYAFPGYVITCWFEQGGLTEVSLSLR